MAEVAALGLVLGVLPLIVSAIEDYENVCRPLGHYKNYALESIKVQQRLGAEKVVFLEECKLLLQTASSASVASQMVADVKHDAWRDQDLNDTLTEYIAGYKGHFHQVIEDIRASILAIEILCQSYGIVDKESTTGTKSQASHPRHWRTHIGKRLRYSFGASGLQEKLHELEKLRHLFVDISSQIRESIKLSTAHAMPKRTTHVSSSKASEYKVIQDASRELYEALGKAWDCHDEHSLHIRLDTNQGLKQSRIHFHLGLRSGDEQSPIWLAIESVSTSANECLPQKSSDPCPITKRVLANAFGIQDIQQRSVHVERVSRVRIQRASAWQSPLWSEDIEYEAKHQFNQVKADNSIHSKICEQLQHHVDQDVSLYRQEEKCIGFLEANSKYRHHLYVTPKRISNSQSSSVSLSHFMSPVVRQSPLGDLNLYEKFRLARQLSEAVLHYHPTPVMRIPWASEDVVFFGKDSTDDQQRPSIASPHLKVKIKSRPPVVTHQEDESFSPRNHHLFALAVLLFEIAYQTSIEELHIQFRSSVAHSNKQEDYNLVQKVCKNFMSAKIGIPYKAIVYKCLNCDFGTGEDDLSSSALQRAFYEHVVCALERLEREQEEIYGAHMP